MQLVCWRQAASHWDTEGKGKKRRKRCKLLSPELAGGQILMGGSWLFFISVVSLVKRRFYKKTPKLF